MDVAIEEGFYLDPDTKRMFYVKKGIVPVWVKSKPSDWRIISRSKNGNKS